MATYYIDATTGDDGDSGLTEALAWKTIAKVNGEAFVGDDFILFKCGETWNETLTIPSAGTLGHPITFGAYGTGDDPIIDGTGLDYCIQETAGKGYITIDGLELADAVVWGLYHVYFPAGIEGATPNWIVQNCTFTHCGLRMHGPNTIVQDNVFVGPGPTAILGALVFRGLVAENCQALRNTISGYCSRGIWFMRGSISPIANDNIVHDIAYSYGTEADEGYGINFDGYDLVITGTVTVLRNTVYNCAANGIELENCSDGSLVNKNLVYDCKRGILYMNYAAYAEHYAEQRGNDINAVIAYNIMYHCTYGVKLEQVSGVQVWNNTIYDGTSGGMTINDAGAPGAYFSTDIDFRNNIVGSGMTKAVSLEFTKEIHLSEFDYNAVELGTVIEERSPVDYLTLVELQAEGWALHCFTTDPLFVDAAGHDFHLLSTSPCINTGVDVGLTEDFEGNPIV